MDFFDIVYSQKAKNFKKQFFSPNLVFELWIEPSSILTQCKNLLRTFTLSNLKGNSAEKYKDEDDFVEIDTDIEMEADPEKDNKNATCYK